MARRETRTLTVVNKLAITPNMMRITLGGDELSNFPEGQESGYMKILLDTEKGSIKRSYSIRAFRAELRELDLDFVLHGDSGPASKWAKEVKVGEVISLMGPGPVKRISNSEDWYFLACDMTALPAMSVNLEEMPREAKGHAVIEIIDEADKQKIEAPENMELHWVLNPQPDQSNTILPEAVMALPWLAGKPNVWLACEFNGMRKLRAYFKEERRVSKDEIYISSYWKMGDTDEGHKKAKTLDNVTGIFK